MRKFKKGFTIVELVIVIAVIAVLTAVLVPTFIHLTNKANKASDESLVTNLNKALAMREAEQGESGKNNTMYDAVLDLKEEGYLAPQLVSKSDQKLLWSQKANRFFLNESYNEAEHGKKYNCFHVEESIPSSQEWGIYAGPKWTVDSVPALTVSFDAGEASVSSISYVRTTGDAQEVVIRTNGAGTTLTVNAPADTVHHYDYLDDLTITAVAGASYHEHGSVKGKATVSDGHFVVEEKGFVNELAIPASATTASVDVKNQGSVSTVVVDNATAPVVIDSGATVAQIVAENTSNISGSGSAAAKESAVAKAQVATEAEFEAALRAKKPYIVFTSGFVAAQEKHVIDTNVIIDGANKEVTTSINKFQFLHVKNSNISVTINNFSYSSTSGTAFIRVGEDGTSYSGVKLNLSGCTITEKYYALNLRKNLKCELNILKSTITGWAAINSWAYDSLFNINNSTMIGRSISNESYGTLVFDGGAYFIEGGTTYGLNVNVNNSTLKQVTTGYASSEQYAISVQFGAKLCNVYLNNCSILTEGEGLEDLCYEFTNDNGSKIYKDGILVYEGVEPQVWYSNGTFASDKSTAGSMNSTFKKPFDEYWMSNGEGIILLTDVALNSNATCTMKSGSFYVYFAGHSVTGGKLVINKSVSVISDTSGKASVFECSLSGYNITETANGNGTYTYSCVAAS